MERITKSLIQQARYFYTPLSPYSPRIKFLGKRSLLELGNQQVAPVFKYSLSDFKHTKSTFVRRIMTQEEIDVINAGGQDVKYKHIPKIKVKKEEDF
ncbi:hypothetical protein ABPG74_004160 [Tetrahymena malaccensis]